MPRHKTLSDRDVLAAAHKLIHERGPEALTFESLARACGLSASTLVQRFGTKAGLKQSTLLHAWDRLDEKTASLAATVPKTAAGAIELLVALSRDYGGIEAYAEGLLVLREDLRDPVLRARGAAWKACLSARSRIASPRCRRSARHRPADRRAMAGIAAVVELRPAGTTGPFRRGQPEALRGGDRHIRLFFSPCGRRWLTGTSGGAVG